MPRPIHLFVSSSAELQLEREVVGQTVAQLPLTIGWQIDHTPQPGAPAAEDLSRVASSDLYVLILGHDFSAPMGAELRQLQQQAGRQPLLYRKRCTRSPSSQDAVRRLELDWRTFLDPDELRALLRRDLLRALLQRAGEVGLDMHELEQLLQLAEKESGEREKRTAEGSGRGEAGRSGVILGREIWEEEP
jgi:hypothetical protein